MRILLTGGAGLIGRGALPRLLSAGHEVRLYDLRAGQIQGESGLEKIVADILDSESLDRAMQGVDGVVHLAGISQVVEAEADPRRCTLINVEGTQKVASAMAKNATGGWLVLASSREVYGEPESVPVAETAALRPFNQYGRSKAAAEQAVEEEARSGLLNAVSLRFSNVYGLPQDHPGRVVPAFVTNALQGQPLQIQGGNKILDFTHVEDAGRAIESAIGWLTTHKRSGALVRANVAGGKGTTLEELTRAIVRIADSQSELVDSTSRPFEVSRFVGDPTLAADKLGFRCVVPLELGLRKTVQAFRDQMDHPRT